MEWTAASIWTKRTFGYGYFECKYKYAAAFGTNNSFWLYPNSGGVKGDSNGLNCEIDTNEGHFPNQINTNIHRLENDAIVNSSMSFAEDLSPGYAHTFGKPVSTKRIRLYSESSKHLNIGELRVYQAKSDCKFPRDILSDVADQEAPNLVNLVRGNGVKITSSGTKVSSSVAKNVADGKVNSGWASQVEGDKWLEFEWPEEKDIGHVQFTNGWNKAGN